MPIFILTLVIGALAFGYTLTPLAGTPRKTKRMRQLRKRHDRVRDMASTTLEEASLEHEAGKLSDEEYAEFVQQTRAELESEDDELEREIQRVRKKSRPK